MAIFTVNNVEAVVNFNDSGYSINGIESVAVTNSITKSISFSGKRDTDGVVVINGANTADSFVFTRTSSDGSDIFKQWYLSHTRGSITVQSLTDSSANYTLIKAIPTQGTYQSLIDTDPSSKIIITIEGMLSDNSSQGNSDA